MISIPLAVLIIAGLIWGINVLSGKGHPWISDVCRILFAAAAFALMFALVRTPIT